MNKLRARNDSINYEHAPRNALHKTHFDAQLRNPTLLGGKTIGEELAILKERYDDAEKRAMETSDRHFVSENWDGDVYIGSRWNTLSVIYMIFMLSIFGSMLFAWLSFGHLWGVTPGLY